MGGDRRIPSTPKVVWERPTVLLDSGQSVGESVFLDRMRLWIHQSLSAHANSFKVPAVWTLYPRDFHADYHGAYPISEYDKWEVRPIRWRKRPLDRRGFLATAAMFEEGCHRKQIKAPWREHNQKGKRACYVYLNPNRRDLDWGSRHYETFRNAYNIPELILGEPLRHALPANSHEWISGVWTYQKEIAKRLQGAFWNRFGYHLPWWRWWEEDRESTDERPLFGIAEAWGDVQVMRHPGMAMKWIGGDAVRPESDTKWESLIGATWCQFYIIATTRESIPFDAMIAAARGAKLVAPDVPAFRNIPGEHLLYPAHQTGDNILWSQSDVAGWVVGRLQNALGTSNRLDSQQR